eukprot:g3894.t1
MYNDSKTDPSIMARQAVLKLPPGRMGCSLVTSAVLKPLTQQKLLTSSFSGHLHLFLTSPGASLSLNENADPTVQSDMDNAMKHLVPSSLAKSAPSVAATQALLFGCTLILPVEGGRLNLGTWQGIYLCQWTSGKDSGDHTVLATLLPASSPKSFRVATFPLDYRGCHPIASSIGPAGPAAETSAKSSGPAESLLQQLPEAKTCQQGLAHLLIKHTSASAMVGSKRLTEKISGSTGKRRQWDKSRQEMRGETIFNTLVPNQWNREFFEHTYEGDDDMPGHVKSSLVGVCVTFPMHSGRPLLGSGQSVILNEHRDCGGWGGGHSRQLAMNVASVPAACQATMTLPKASEGERVLVVSPKAIVEALPAIAQAKSELSAVLVVPRTLLSTPGLVVQMLEAVWQTARDRQIGPERKQEKEKEEEEEEDDEEMCLRNLALQVMSAGPSLTLGVGNGKVFLGEEQAICVLLPATRQSSSSSSGSSRVHGFSGKKQKTQETAQAQPATDSQQGSSQGQPDSTADTAVRLMVTLQTC